MSVASIHVPHLNRAMKLGRRAPDPAARKRTLKFTKYFRGIGAVPPPATVDYFTKASDSIKRVYLNDQFGDCVIAGKHHLIGVWTGNDSPQTAVATDAEVYQQYQSICGPGDNGCVITNVLDTFQQRGLTASGQVHKIDGYVAIDWTNKLEVQVALFLFGGLTIGINLPSAWANSAAPGAIWDVTRSEIVGGHDVTVCGYNSVGVQIATWGMIVTITWQAFLQQTWVEECYAPLSPDWYGNDQLAPCGVSAAQLKADLDALKNGQIPDPGPGPTPVVPPSPPVPPVPPVPPAPSFPAYTVTGTAMVPGWFGHTQVAFTGQAVPASPNHFHAPAISGPILRINWFALIGDLNQLRRDLGTANPAALAAGVRQLIADVQARNWGAIGNDITQLEQLAGQANWAAISADVAKILVDLGV